MVSVNLFKTSTYLLYKNPILFLLPSIGCIISIVSEAIFVIGLRNNDNQNYFPFSDIMVLFLFFISFTIAYFQLFIARKVITLDRVFKTKGNYCYNVIIVELLVIYSIYALALADIGDYEGDVRKSLASVKSDRFSLYTSMIHTYDDNKILVIVPFGIIIVLLSTVISFFFNAWMVQYMLLAGDQNVSRGTVSSGNIVYILYESLKNVVSVTIDKQKHKNKDEKKKKEKRDKISSLFILTALISITGFILTNIAVFPIEDGLSLYVLQFVVLNIIGTIYSPFFLICLFLAFLS